MPRTNFMAETGTLGTLLRATDWCALGLGAPAEWPQSLQTALSIVLRSAQPKLLLWGPQRRAFYNEAYIPLLGPKYAGTIALPYEELRPDLWPIIKQLIYRAYDGQSDTLTDFPVLSQRSGSTETLTFTVTYSPVSGEGGSIMGALFTLTETTHHVTRMSRLAEENNRLRGLFDQSPAFLALTEGPEHRFVYANQAFFLLIGRDDVIGKTVNEVMPEALEQGFVDLLDRTYSSGAPFVGTDMRLVLESRQQEAVYVNFVFQPIRDAKGNVTGILSDGYDVTEQHLARGRAERLQAELVHVSRVSAMGTLATALAHELNQPLSAAANYLGAFKACEKNAAAEQRPLYLLDGAEEQIIRAGSIIRRLRDMVAKKQLEVRPVALKEVFAEVVNMLRAVDSWQHVDIILDLENEAETVLGDHIQLEQLLLNLIRNALQAVQARSDGRVDVIARREDNHVILSINDNGPGFGERDPDQAFDAFACTSSGGLGIGLSICRAIVESHGGTISATSHDRGASFRVRLPSGTGRTDTSEVPAPEETVTYQR